MALQINDRVKVTSTTTGTGAFTLGAAQNGFVAFGISIGSLNTTYYTIANQGTNEWEVGVGTLNNNSTVLTRTTIISSSNVVNAAYAVVDFLAGTKDVFCTLPASKAVYLDAEGNTVNAAGAGFAVAMAIAL